jgi:lipoyl(octanoyl) transferase
MTIDVRVLGRMAYADALALQEAVLAARLAGGPDTLLLVEHPPVYTLGRGSDARHLGLAAGGPVEVVRVARGGQVTYHGPGQLVGYPILDLRGHRLDVRWYVRALEDVLIAALADLGIGATRRDGFPGVWTARGKIGSIGIALRRWVTWHGFALNVGPDLSGFDAITPCGISGVQMTSVAREGGPGEVERVIPVVVRRFRERFGHDGLAAAEEAR